MVSKWEDVQHFFITDLRFPFTGLSLLRATFFTEPIILLAVLVSQVDPDTGPVEPFLATPITTDHPVLVVGGIWIIPMIAHRADVGVFIRRGVHLREG